MASVAALAEAHAIVAAHRRAVARAEAAHTERPSSRTLAALERARRGLARAEALLRVLEAQQGE